MHLPDDTDVLARLTVHGDLQLESELEVAAEPDDPRIDRARRLSGLQALCGRLHRELHDGDHAVEGGRQPDVSHVGLQVLQAVLDREAPVEDLRVQLLLDLDVPLVGGRVGLVDTGLPSYASAARLSTRNLTTTGALLPGRLRARGRAGHR